MNLQIGTKLAAIAFLLQLPIARAAEERTPATKPMTVVANDDGLLVTENGKPVMQYQLRTKSLNGNWSRGNYIHPLYNLDGEVITEDFPDDHKHHRGIFWAWHQVFVGDIRLGDSWACKDFVWDVESKQATVNRNGTATLSAHVLWKSPALKDDKGNTIAAVSEHTQVTVHPATPDYRQIDFDIRLKAFLPDVSIGGSEDEKGYGGFSPRIRLSKEQEFVSSDGEIEPVKKSIMAGPWMDISDEKWGMAMLTHPANPGTPQPWILRRQRSMQNAVYPGRELTPLSAETETRLRYRLVIHRGSNSGLHFAHLQKQYGQAAKE